MRKVLYQSANDKYCSNLLINTCVDVRVIIKVTTLSVLYTSFSNNYVFIKSTKVEIEENNMETLPVTLIVKAPNQQIEDQTVKCELSWTINKLKQHLSEVYPSNPPSHEQKLIYSGQLLSDSVVLKDVLRQYDGQDTHTVHLVCSPNINSTVRVKKQSSTEMASHTPPTTTPEVSPNNSNTDQRVPPNMQWYNQQNGDQQAVQYLMMQQAYFQYMTHYMNLYISAVNQNVPNALSSNLNPPPQLQPQQLRNQQGGEVQNGAGIQQPPAQQPQQDPERDQNRDWLDIFYTISRLMIFSSIIYFYSSPLRFVFVLLLCLGLYLYHNGFFRNVNINNNNIVQGEAPQDEQTPSRLMVAWTFFTTFFASLIPDIPNVV